MINRIKVPTFNSYLFKQLCEEMDAEHTHVVLYTEMRWFSKCRSLARVFELQGTLQRFLYKKKRKEKVTTGSTFQRHRMSCKTLLLV